jgi:hypothetical protein
VLAKRWYKRMDTTAAQQPPSAGTNPTGNLRLSQETFAIDHKIYFRDVFFGGYAWAPRPKDPRFEDLTVGMDVIIDGTAYGTTDVRISHAPHRISGQGNVPTVLHWGRRLGPILKATNYTGYYTNLERWSDGSIRLIISKRPSGPFAY